MATGYKEGVGLPQNKTKDKKGRKKLAEGDRMIRFSIGMREDVYAKVNAAAKKNNRPLSVQINYLCSLALEYDAFMKRRGMELAKRSLFETLAMIPQEDEKGKVEEVSDEEVLRLLSKLDKKLLRTASAIMREAHELGYELTIEQANSFYKRIHEDIDNQKTHILKKAETPIEKNIEKKEVFSIENFIVYLKENDLAHSPQVILSEAQKLGLEIDFSRASDLYKEVKLQSLFK
jgi:hypothetical protein